MATTDAPAQRNETIVRGFEERDCNSALEGARVRVDFSAGSLAVLSGHVNGYAHPTREVLAG